MCARTVGQGRANCKKFSGDAATSRGHARRVNFLIRTAVVCTLALAVKAAEPQAELRVDFRRTNGVIRPLHGINKGPLVAGGIIDLTAGQRELNTPLNRLHDCRWPNPDVVDIHTLFPDFNADPDRAESYAFAATDEYIAGVLATGAQVVYRLGESIEHTKTKRWVHPPRDMEKWARICAGVVRHYNHGWAGGARHGIRYWEIWNEPENRPSCWTGSDEDFLRLYAAASRAVKAVDATLKVGGASFGYSGKFERGVFQPSEFVTNFLARCRRDALPLDFFSWHCYTDDPAELTRRTRAIRALLDAHGFTKAENHLNEWNYLPGNSWHGLSRTAAPEAREKFYQEMAGPAGAAFLTVALIELQDAPLDAGNFYHAEIGPWGTFTENGVPMKNFHALKAFAAMLGTPRRVSATGGVEGRLAVVAGLDAAGRRAQVLVSHYSGGPARVRLALDGLPWTGESECEVRLVNATWNGTPREWSAASGAVLLDLPAPAVALVSLGPRGK
jgi:hypothetical protein